MDSEAFLFSYRMNLALSGLKIHIGMTNSFTEGFAMIHAGNNRILISFSIGGGSMHGVDEPQKILLKMDQPPFSFYLTGSRFFGNPDEHSDYDFFVLDSEEVREFLQNLGFRNKTVSRYLLPDMKEFQDLNDVWTFQDLIDVQLLKETFFKKKAQNILETMPGGFRNVYYSKRKDAWNWAFRVAKGQI